MSNKELLERADKWFEEHPHSTNQITQPLIKDLQTEIRRLREALEFYGNKDNYGRDREAIIFTKIGIEGGALARRALNSKEES